MLSFFSKKSSPKKHTKKTQGRAMSGAHAHKKTTKHSSQKSNSSSEGQRHTTNQASGEFVGEFSNHPMFHEVANKNGLQKAKMRGEVIDPQEFSGGRATWRIFRIMSEFVEGYDFLSQMRSSDVTVFGSARLKEGTEDYERARKLGELLAKEGFAVITGGGPGIMEATNRGAHEAGGESIGLNIQLPFEQRINPYVGRGIGFHYFFTRKVMLTSPSHAFVAFPGGFGTMDEVMEVMTLIQTKKMDQVPVIFMGTAFWQPFFDYCKKVLLDQYGTISAGDLDMFVITDDPEEAVQIIIDHEPPQESEQRIRKAHEEGIHAFQGDHHGE